MRLSLRTVVVAALLAVLLTTAAAAPMILKGLQLPTMNDVSTDLVDPPGFVTLSVPTYPSEFAEKQRTGYPDLRTRVESATREDLFGRAVAAARALGWDVVAEDPIGGRIEAVATTSLMRFKDDVVIRIREQDGGVALDMRSRSRLGRHDLGANADRIRSFLAVLDR